MYKSIELKLTASWLLLLGRNSLFSWDAFSLMFQRLWLEICPVADYGSYAWGLNFPISEAGIFVLFINNSNNGIMVLWRLVFVELKTPAYAGVRTRVLDHGPRHLKHGAPRCKCGLEEANAVHAPLFAQGCSCGCLLCFGWITEIFCFRFQGGETMPHEYEEAPFGNAERSCYRVYTQASELDVQTGSPCTLPRGPSLHTLSPPLPPTHLPPLLSTDCI